MFSSFMIIVAQYSFKNGKDFIEKNHPNELAEVKEIIANVDCTILKTKISKEKTMNGRELYAPKKMNPAFKVEFKKRGWSVTSKNRILTKTMVPEIQTQHSGYREMDAIKNKLGAEVQLGKYAFMVYNVSAKMTIFAKNKKIDAGIEIVPMHSLAREMSSGVSHFEQMKTDLEMRGESNIDIPVLILGIDVFARPKTTKTSVDKPLGKFGDNH
jgi:hypothetical protein